MSNLEKDVWIFPIYKYGSKKYIPILYAMVLAYLIPTLLIIILSPITYNNAFLFQLEYIFIALFFTFVGVLTRSKLRSFLNFIPALASYFTIEFFIQGVFSFNPPIANPYGAFNVLADPLKAIASNLPDQRALIESLAGYMFVIDLIFILLIAQIGGFFTSMLSTGFWNPEGKFGIMAVFSKMIALPFVIIFIIILPIVLHATGSIAGGAAYIGAGAVELSGVFGGFANGAQANGIDLENIDFEDLRERSRRASNYFSIANDKLSQVKGNIFVGVAIEQLIANDPQMASFENISSILDLVGSISEITYVLPELMMGFSSLQKGFSSTIGIIGESQSGTAIYNPDFDVGVKHLEDAFANFTIAWDSTDNETGERHGLLRAVEIASVLKDIAGLEDYINVNEFMDALNTSVVILLSLDQAFIQFLRGTYKITLAVQEIANNNFDNADTWMGDALADFEESNKSLSIIQPPGKVAFTIFNNANDKSDNTSIEIPVDGVVRIAQDLNALLIEFGYGAKEGLNLFEAMDDVMTSMDGLNWSDSDAISDPAYWTSVDNNLNETRGYFDLSFSHISEAERLSNENKQKSYGTMLNPIFVEGDNSFFNQLAKQVTNFKTNLTDFNFLLQSFANTTYAFRDYSFGMGEFNSWYDEIDSTGDSNNDTLDSAKAYFLSSQDYSVKGYVAIGFATGLNAEVVTDWRGILYDPFNTTNIDTIYGIDQKSIDLVTSLLSIPEGSTEFLLLMAYIDQMQLAGILGGS